MADFCWWPEAFLTALKNRERHLPSRGLAIDACSRNTRFRQAGHPADDGQLVLSLVLISPLSRVCSENSLHISKAYIVASINVTDPDGYEAYLNGAVKVTKGAGGKLLVSGGRTEAIEGTFNKRIVVIEFESFEAARAAAAGYTALRDTRGTSAPDYDSVIVEGVELAPGPKATSQR